MPRGRMKDVKGGGNAYKDHSGFGGGKAPKNDFLSDMTGKGSYTGGGKSSSGGMAKKGY